MVVVVVLCVVGAVERVVPCVAAAGAAVASFVVVVAHVVLIAAACVDVPSEKDVAACACAVDSLAALFRDSISVNDSAAAAVAVVPSVAGSA